MSESKKLSKRLVLKDTHPTAVKISKLMELADELGISISFLHQRVLIKDKDRDENLPPLFLEDIEEGHWFESFPFETEYKLVYVNPEFLAQEKRDHEERIRIRDEQERLDKEKAAQLIAEKTAAAARALEARERRQLAELKEKYENE
jgi:hypothetical protein